MLKKSFLQSLLVVAIIAVAGTAMAATSVSWTSPANNSTFAAGTVVQPIGQGSAAGGSGGTGLDLALVLDSSGSMIGSRTLAQRNAANALVDALPQATTSVAVIDFDSSASTVKQLTPLTTDKAGVKTAIDNINASGGTNIALGIDVAKAELTSARATASRQQMMVVLSDGQSFPPGPNADAAIAAGVEAIHSIGIPGHTANVMRDIADGPDQTVGTADDNGIYTNASDLDALIGLFNGTGGNLVGLKEIDVELPDGTLLDNIGFDGLGNFTVPVGYTLALGNNIFKVTATGTDDSTDTATLNLIGVGNNPVPEPATMLLFGTGLAGLAGIRRRKK